LDESPEELLFSVEEDLVSVLLSLGLEEPFPPLAAEEPVTADERL
jgi:hypothetical protein